MFDWIDKHKRVIQIVLLILIVPPFAFFGINYYFQDRGAGGAVAKVAGTSISPQEFDQALRERQEQLRKMMQGKEDQAMLDSNEVRNAVLNGLVDKRALLAHALQAGVAVPDDQLRKILADMPSFKDETTGKFSDTKYRQLLEANGMTPAGFEDRMRQDLRLSQVRDTVIGSVVLPAGVIDRLGRIREQQREISQWLIGPDDVKAKVALTDAAIKAFYEEHKADFKVPERARVEYLTLTLDGVAKKLTIPAAEIAQEFEKRKQQLASPEERKASHILIAVAKDAKPEVKAAARKRAEGLVAEIRATPKSFADLARKYSQDPGSAKNGGDLGYFAPGTMVKAFDTAVQALEVGEIAGPVETPYGFHVIRLDAIKAGVVASLDKVGPEIEQELRKIKAGRAFAEAAEQLQDLVNKQADSLKLAADTLGLPIQKSDWVTRNGGGDPLLVKPELLSKIFSDDGVRGKLNTNPVEVAQNTVISARVIEHRAADVLPFDDVKRDVRDQLLIERAGKIVEDDGKAMLTRLRGGDDKGVKWTAPALVSLQNPGSLPPAAARDVFGASPDKLPAYVGMALGKGRYTIYRISRVADGKPMDADRRKALSQQLSQLAAQQQFDAYLQAVKAQSGIEIDASKIERKAQ